MFMSLAASAALSGAMRRRCRGRCRGPAYPRTPRVAPCLRRRWWETGERSGWELRLCRGIRPDSVVHVAEHKQDAGIRTPVATPRATARAKRLARQLAQVGFFEAWIFIIHVGWRQVNRMDMRVSGVDHLAQLQLSILAGIGFCRSSDAGPLRVRSAKRRRTRLRLLGPPPQPKWPTEVSYS